jgi:hypothetical protein
MRGKFTRDGAIVHVLCGHWVTDESRQESHRDDGSAASEQTLP